ncbi:MAG: antitoxin [Candidatus Binatia bacterium]
MNQLTVRGFDEELEAEIRRVAEREHLSLNQAVLRILRRGAGLEEDSEEAGRVGSSLDHLAGTWSTDEAEAMAAVEAEFERIDPELWG